MDIFVTGAVFVTVIVPGVIIFVLAMCKSAAITDEQNGTRG
jgi:hypothetical protein